MRSFDASLARLPDFDNVTAIAPPLDSLERHSSSPARSRLGLGLLRGRDKYQALEKRRRPRKSRRATRLDLVDLMDQADARPKSRATSVVCGNRDK